MLFIDLTKKTKQNESYFKGFNNLVDGWSAGPTKKLLDATSSKSVSSCLTNLMLPSFQVNSCIMLKHKQEHIDK